jgi:hypothetical protein
MRASYSLAWAWLFGTAPAVFTPRAALSRARRQRLLHKAHQSVLPSMKIIPKNTTPWHLPKSRFGHKTASLRSWAQPHKLSRNVFLLVAVFRQEGEHAVQVLSPATALAGDEAYKLQWCVFQRSFAAGLQVYLRCVEIKLDAAASGSPKHPHPAFCSATYNYKPFVPLVSPIEMQRIISTKYSVFSSVLPELRRLREFDQKNRSCHRCRQNRTRIP